MAFNILLFILPQVKIAILVLGIPLHTQMQTDNSPFSYGFHFLFLEKVFLIAISTTRLRDYLRDYQYKLEPCLCHDDEAKDQFKSKNFKL